MANVSRKEWLDDTVEYLLMALNNIVEEQHLRSEFRNIISASTRQPEPLSEQDEVVIVSKTQNWMKKAGEAILLYWDETNEVYNTESRRNEAESSEIADIIAKYAPQVLSRKKV